MKLRYKILNVILALLAVGVLSSAILFSYDADCGPPPALTPGATPMKAVVHRCYGAPEVRAPRSREAGAQRRRGPDQGARGGGQSARLARRCEARRTSCALTTGIGTPKDARVGVDFAGTVEAVGKNVTRFKPGDEVFGGADGAFAEYVVVRETRASAQAGQRDVRAGGLRCRSLRSRRCRRCATMGRLRPGQKVLINGASGGVGTFAVQIAKTSARKSPACAARATWSWCARSAPTT